ncbi:UPF0676 protein C1494.01-like [Lingula anatina]|uniref:UPF0676 protein C1494.01-like n=1 Tax=Lingula anatina TaxID=7574 RepID=A0A1S3JIE7_LINAN|nr:UPF0676 protein C1494.01-like [Lingula anatina]|eukprot:XP_013409674.1 UPF0676 protein C1494.01-like [Lingula anatina]
MTTLQVAPYNFHVPVRQMENYHARDLDLKHIANVSPTAEMTAAQQHCDLSWIPVIDIKAFDITKEENEVDRKEMEKLANDVFKAFSTVGFVYVKNHGIPQDQLENIFSLADEFFAQPQETKDKFIRPLSDPSGIGYIPIGREMESFDAIPGGAYNQLWPGIPNFEKDVVEFHRTCAKLSLRMLKLIGMGLGLEDQNELLACHTNLVNWRDNSSTTLRLLTYPPYTEKEDLTPGQTRCGEHTDYGSITLLFQDDIGGLEVQTVAGEYKPATPIPDTIVVILADMMPRWTSDRLKATLHRVVPSHRNNRRRSLIYFTDPDRSTIVKPLDGSDTYPPICYTRYVTQQFVSTGILGEDHYGDVAE